MSTICDFFNKLLQEGGNGNFLIIKLKDNAYLQFSAEKGGHHIYCEAAGNNAQLSINASQEQALSNLGWTPPANQAMHSNFSQQFSIESANDLESLEELVHTTAEVYSSNSTNYTYELNLE